MVKQPLVDPHKYVRLANPSPMWYKKWAERAMAAKLNAMKNRHIKETR